MMRLRLDVLYTYDDRGRLLLSNEPVESSRVARAELALAYANGRSELRIGASIPDEVAGQLRAIPAEQLLQTDLDTYLAEIEGMLSPHGTWTRGGGPAYRFPDAIAPHADAVEITHANSEFLREHIGWLIEELDDWSPVSAAVVDGSAVSICMSSRSNERCAEAGLWTAEAFRGRGFGPIVTQSWAATIQKSGRIPFYSTWWANDASRAVARKLELISIGEDVTYRRSEPLDIP
ncbi:N/A [soil metagenome]